MSEQTAPPATRTTDIDGLTISWDPRVLEPRPWTAQQGQWLAELAAGAPDGPVLELCCGAGHIGLVAARRTGRDLVQVDRDEAAVGYAIANAAAAGVEADVRRGDVGSALAPDELFGLVLADPPWLRTDELARFPDDPAGAVDGGPDGTAVIREVVAAATAHTAPHGHLVVQVGTPDQATFVAALLEEQDRGWAVAEVRDLRPGGVLVHVARRPEPSGRDAATEGSVSEGGALGDSGIVFPSDATAGYPLADDEGGAGVQEGSAGPDAAPRDDDRGRRR